jgi:hypothetical protein
MALPEFPRAKIYHGLLWIKVKIFNFIGNWKNLHWRGEHVKKLPVCCVWNLYFIRSTWFCDIFSLFSSFLFIYLFVAREMIVNEYLNIFIHNYCTYLMFFVRLCPLFSQFLPFNRFNSNSTGYSSRILSTRIDKGYNNYCLGQSLPFNNPVRFHSIEVTHQ